MKNTILILILIQSFFMLGQKKVNEKGFNIIADKIGDLDNDRVDERVVVYQTKDSTEYGLIREIYILKKVDGKWTNWKNSRNAILRSDEGGMMGDPFDGIEINNGILSINFFGGSSWKWSFTDKYRFQNNEFELIGYTHTYFKLCEYWENDDFNLSTGKIISKKEYEKCEKDGQEVYKRENEIFYKKGLKITLQNRNKKEIKILTPTYGREIYISSGA